MQLIVNDITFCYGGRVAVDGVSFSLKGGQALALVGPNGSGKSTLVDIISGYLMPQRGNCSIGDKVISGLNTAAIATFGLCRTFQYPRYAAGMTCFENVLASALPSNKMRWYRPVRPDKCAGLDSLRTQACYWLDVVGLSHMGDDLASQLSFGQCKLLNLACVLVREPRIILLDEPAAGVSQRYRSKLLDILSKLKKQEVQVLVIEHDLDFVRSFATQLIVLEQGKILAQGSPKETLALPEVLNAYVG